MEVHRCRPAALIKTQVLWQLIDGELLRVFKPKFIAVSYQFQYDFRHTKNSSDFRSSCTSCDTLIV
jgi:hypothetical protein